MAFFETTIKGTFLGQAIQHTRYYETASAVTNFQPFVDALGVILASELSPVLSNDMTYQTIGVRRNTPGFPGVELVPASWPFSGDRTADNLGPNITVNLQLRSGGLVYPVRGLVQLSGLCEDVQSDGRILPSLQTIFDAAAAAFAMNVDGGGGVEFQPRLYSATYDAYSSIATAQARGKLGKRETRELS